MTLEAVRRSVGDKSGATAIEYALIVCLVAVAVIVSIVAMTGRLTDALDEVSFEPGVAFHTQSPQ